MGVHCIPRLFLAVLATSIALLSTASAKDVKLRHVLTLDVFDRAHKKIFTLDHVTIDPQSNPFVTPKVGDLISVSIKGEITSCVVTTTATTYVLDPDADPTVSVAVGLTQTPARQE